MKQIIRIIPILLMTLVIVVPASSQKRKIILWCTDKEVAGLSPIAKSFKKERRITVEIEIQAEPRSKYISAARSGTGPDILVGAHDWVGELAKNGVIAELNLSQTDKAKYFPNSIRGFTYNNKIYGIPYDYEALVLFYNKKIIEKPPVTWEELIPVALKLTDTKSGKYGFLYGLTNDFHRNFPFLGAYGAYIFNEKNGKYDINDLGLDSPNAIEGGKFIYRLVKEGVVPISTNNGTVESSFLDGKVAMVMDGCWNYRSYVNAIGKENIGVSKLPLLNGKVSRSFIGARGFLVNNASKVIEHAKDFAVNFAGETEGQLAMYQEGGRPPANIKAAEIISTKNPHIKTMIESANDGVLMPNVKAMAVVFNYAAGCIDRFNTGEISVENALKQGSASIRTEIMNKMSRYE